MLRFDKISLGFGDGPVLKNFSLEVLPGEVVVLLGRSGCGKTTLLRLAAGLLRPDAGRVANGFSRTAVVFQEPRLLPWSSARENVAFALAARGVPPAERDACAKALLARFGFAAADMEKRPLALSGGMQSRVAIARALVVEPDLVLMDEPFAALDIGLRRDLQDLVRETVESTRRAVLFVTHDVTEAVRLADRLVVLSPRPAKIVHEARTVPVVDPARIHMAAAALLDRPEVSGALMLSGRPPAATPVEEGYAEMPAVPDCVSGAAG
ncbi:ABC transporter related protein [Rhodovulum sp. PH10]|uniref:ABC transporter ATP-binding protein n=1 Tax=Rhodovulum sp. PH10 TaxID=1187851 RepID=UPI00027C1F94|nr:ABC transporter ATP-binding protein [Rhodovulum sp. PH10]EJW13525.1 ABC transporter related protein [Rhodovulum sp. PH10]